MTGHRWEIAQNLEIRKLRAFCILPTARLPRAFASGSFPMIFPYGAILSIPFGRLGRIPWAVLNFQPSLPKFLRWKPWIPFQECSWCRWAYRKIRKGKISKATWKIREASAWVREILKMGQREWFMYRGRRFSARSPWNRGIFLWILCRRIRFAR